MSDLSVDTVSVVQCRVTVLGDTGSGDTVSGDTVSHNNTRLNCMCS